jgi:SAM-dependent MidA family methyltransferase
VARSLRRGFSFVIDYGDRAGRLYDSDARPAGTLMAYHRHRASEDPFVRVGAQDLTAHVNFSAIEDASAAEGLATIGLTTQHRFLIALGLADRIADLSSSSTPVDVRRRLAMMSLIHPEGMGGIFRVLVQGKGVGPAPLRGLQDPFAPSGASPWSRRRREL